MFPVLGREVVESEQRVSILAQAVGRLLVFQRVALDEGVERQLCGDLRFSHPYLLQRAFGFRLLALRQLGEHVRGLVHPAALLARFRPDLAGGLPEPECAIGDDEPRGRIEPAPLQIEQQIAPVVRALAGAIGEADQFFAAFRRRTDQHEDALLFVFQAGFEMDAVGPDVDVTLRRQIALLPRGVLVKPTVLQAADGGCRQPGSILAEQRRQSLGEVAGGDTLQVKDRQQRLDRLRPAHVGRQDRRREPDAVGVGSVRLAIAYTRLADRDRTDTGHHLAFRQVTVAHDALVAVRGLQIGMLAEKVRDLGLDRLGQQSTRPIAQDFGELIVDVSWLNQLDDVILGHGISLLRWRSGGVKHPHDMPPSRFPPSPTFSDSSAPHPTGVVAERSSYRANKSSGGVQVELIIVGHTAYYRLASSSFGSRLVPYWWRVANNSAPWAAQVLPGSARITA